jgi:hypothetical protein
VMSSISVELESDISETVSVSIIRRQEDFTAYRCHESYKSYVRYCCSEYHDFIKKTCLCLMVQKGIEQYKVRDWNKIRLRLYQNLRKTCLNSLV